MSSASFMMQDYLRLVLRQLSKEDSVQIRFRLNFTHNLKVRYLVSLRYAAPVVLMHNSLGYVLQHVATDVIHVMIVFEGWSNIDGNTMSFPLTNSMTIF